MTTGTIRLDLTPAELGELLIAVTIPDWENDDWQSVRLKVAALAASLGHDHEDRDHVQRLE